MLNTNKIISYLTHKHPLLDKTVRSHQTLMQETSHLAPVADGLGEKPVEQAEQSFAGAVKEAYSGLQAKAVELDFSMSCSENFMLGESVTSFYMPPQF